MKDIDVLDEEEKAELSEQDREAKRKREQEEIDILTLMKTKEGRRFVWRLLSFSGVFRSSFTGNSTTFFNEGRRDVGLLIFSEVMEVCPDLYKTMQQEAKEESNV